MRRFRVYDYTKVHQRTDASVVHAYCTEQLQANPTAPGPTLSTWRPTQRTVSTMGSIDLVVGEDHFVGQSYQRYNWQTGRRVSIAFGSSPRRGETMISNHHCLAEVPLCGNDIRRQPRGTLRSGAPKSGLTPNSGLSSVAPNWEVNPIQTNPVLCPRAGGSRPTGPPSGCSKHPLNGSRPTGPPSGCCKHPLNGSRPTGPPSGCCKHPLNGSSLTFCAIGLLSERPS